MPTLPVVRGSELSVAGLAGKTVAVLGFGSQGHAHAQNLRDSGVRVIVGQRRGTRFDAAVAAGFTPLEIPDAVRAADLVILALPDDAAPRIFAGEIAAYLRPGQTLGFIHGFVVHNGLIDLPPGVDVVLVAPKAQGRAVRSEYVAGRGIISLIAVHQDATGSARRTALGWAAGIGSNRAAVLETTFREETETDLFGEQAVLCGGLSALIAAGFETLVHAGYPAELAYFECCHEVKLIADLIYEHGIAGMRERISSTARYGDATRGPRIINDAVRAEMRRALAEIRSGAFAREFLSREVAAAPSPNAAGGAGELESIGRYVRELARGAAADRKI